MHATLEVIVTKNSAPPRKIKDATSDLP